MCTCINRESVDHHSVSLLPTNVIMQIWLALCSRQRRNVTPYEVIGHIEANTDNYTAGDKN